VDVEAGDLAWAAEVAGAARRRGLRLLAVHLVVVRGGPGSADGVVVEQLV
jgi:hypothetical protein